MNTGSVFNINGCIPQFNTSNPIKYCLLLDIYYNIKDAEWAEEYKIMQQGITWFQKYFTKQYYVLLD